jgi:hypothetical protein
MASVIPDRSAVAVSSSSTVADTPLPSKVLTMSRIQSAGFIGVTTSQSPRTGRAANSVRSHTTRYRQDCAPPAS